MKKPKMVKITIELDKETLDYLKKIARESGNSVPATIRFLLWQYLKEKQAELNFQN